jgi:hypothetical protein
MSASQNLIISHWLILSLQVSLVRGGATNGTVE